MAGGGVHIGAAGRAADYTGRITAYVMMVAIVAASGGLLFGYDLGVTGGVESMPSFLEKFFPSVYERQQEDTSTNPYCTFNDQMLQLFTSSIFIAGMVCALFAGQITRAYGRKCSMVAGGLCFLSGATLNAAAANLTMLVVGRVLLGFGIGFANQVVPLYLSEMAPAKARGAMNILFQLATTIGILVAQLVNYGVQSWDNGWRLSLGLAAAPAIILTLGGIFLPESPNSLIERGRRQQGRAILQRIRGCHDVQAEFEDMCEAADAAASISQKQAWRNLFSKDYRPSLTLAILIPLFQQWTGINAIMFYVPILFSSMGTGHKGALLNAVIIGGVNLLATGVSIYCVDRSGRKKLLLQGGIQMLVAQVVVAIVMGVEFSKYNTSNLPSSVAVGILIVVCVFVAGFAWSWGPLGWLIPSEVQPLETRSAGFSLTVFVNFLFSFVIGQTFLSMLCALQWGTFLLFAGCVLVMTLFVGFFLPETKGVPLEEIYTVYAKHWFWGKVVGEAGRELVELEARRSASRQFARAEDGLDADASKDGVKDASSASASDSGEPADSQAVMVRAISESHH